MIKFKVGDKVVVKKVAKISKGEYKKGDVGIIESIDCSLAPFKVLFKVLFNGEINTKELYRREIKLYTPKSDNVWIPFKGGKCPVDEDDYVLVQRKSGKTNFNRACMFTNMLDLWSADIVAYQVIYPYVAPRKKIIFKNKSEMLKDLISRGELYINEEGNEHIYFSEDDRYTLGYVAEDGRSEPADGVLDKLEFWVE